VLGELHTRLVSEEKRCGRVHRALRCKVFAVRVAECIVVVSLEQGQEQRLAVLRRGCSRFVLVAGTGPGWSGYTVEWAANIGGRSQTVDQVLPLPADELLGTVASCQVYKHRGWKVVLADSMAGEGPVNSFGVGFECWR